LKERKSHCNKRHLAEDEYLMVALEEEGQEPRNKTRNLTKDESWKENYENINKKHYIRGT
jgi:hypothetical protein